MAASWVVLIWTVLTCEALQVSQSSPIATNPSVSLGRALAAWRSDPATRGVQGDSLTRRVVSARHVAEIPVAMEPACWSGAERFKPMEVIPTPDPCEFCVCPEEGGLPACGSTMCAQPVCVDFAFQTGHCCPTCPQGPNCLIQGETVKSGVTVRTHQDDTCYEECACVGGGSQGVVCQTYCTVGGDVSLSEVAITNVIMQP